MNREELLHKWLNDDLSEEQTQLLKEDSTYATLLDIAQYSSQLETPEFDKATAYVAIKQKTTPGKTIQLTPWKTIAKVAAMVAIVFTVYLFVNSLDTTINAQFGEQITHVLPDDSDIILNAGSAITYNKNDWEQNRDVNLTGEAFFKVAKGSTFTVSTPLGQVQVLGTQFNVYARDNDFAVSCFEGRVSVSLNDEVVTLTKGMGVNWSNGKMTTTQKSELLEPYWMHRESSFSNEALVNVLNELERQYNIKIEAQGVDTNRLFSGSFTHDDLTIALQSICNPLQITYEVKDNDQVVLHEAK
ncbi:MAG: FecR family protein [Gilvibacter sp.]